MSIIRLKDFNELQQALIKSMYKQVKNRCADGKWRDFKADITISGKRYNFECKFRLDEAFLSLAHQSTKDGQGRLVVPDTSIAMPIQ